MGGLSLFRPFIKKSKEVIDLTTNTKAFNFLMSLIDSKGLVDVDLEDYTFKTINYQWSARNYNVPTTEEDFAEYYEESPQGSVDYEKYVTRGGETVLRSAWEYDVYNYAIAKSIDGNSTYVFNGSTSATLTNIAYTEETNSKIRAFSYTEGAYNEISMMLYSDKKDELHIFSLYDHGLIYRSGFYYIIKAPEGYEFEL